MSLSPTGIPLRDTQRRGAVHEQRRLAASIDSMSRPRATTMGKGQQCPFPEAQPPALRGHPLPRKGAGIAPNAYERDAVCRRRRLSIKQIISKIRKVETMKVAKLLAVALLAMTLCSCWGGGDTISNGVSLSFTPKKESYTFDDLAKIEIGMTRAEVVAILGASLESWDRSANSYSFYRTAEDSRSCRFYLEYDLDENNTEAVTSIQIIDALDRVFTLSK